ncbi:nucleobase transporter, putative [Trypanosoma brucei brucei TREU927]|uniref:Nucleobase transporter, putative n=1 Tax=Trypanosoma brucei brucei (strain 927/4 GUTat10.1) TaxID=185431 RepID=Q386E9_TRYB2|nr:nucleobase transporter, putative [Trypanosoma brucei brucei TREU927]EAN79332.1 nucleobase transporter, putative [Trypanosoma brucei brucei TREU927]
MALGFSSAGEVYMYATCILLGISLLMPLCVLVSAPSFMLNYYKYVSGKEDSEPNLPFFWKNIFTFYNVVSLASQVIAGPTVLTRAARRLSLSVRFALSITLMMSEVFVVLMMPVIKVPQTVAIVLLCLVTIFAGIGKSYHEATCYVLVASMPSKFMSAVMFGVSLCGVITSTLQCIIKASMDDTYESVLKQSYIYFSLGILIMSATLAMALCLRYNSYAQEHVAEYRMLKLQEQGVDAESQHDENEPTAEGEGESKGEGGEGDAEGGMTTAEQLTATAVMPVVKIIRMMLLCVFCGFFLTLFIFPSLIIPIDRKHNWFATIAILLYNCGDAIGRFSTSFKCVWPPRRALLYFTFGRFIFILPFILCIYKHIPGHAAPYIFSFLLGLTNCVGAMSMVYGPITPGLETAGQKLMAGQLMGISLLSGIAAASVLAMIVVIFLP